MSFNFIALFAPVVLVMNFRNWHIILVKIVTVLRIEGRHLVSVTVVRALFRRIVSLKNREISRYVFNDLLASYRFSKCKNAGSLRNFIISICEVS